MSVLKSVSSNYVQIMENMILTSYWDTSYFVGRFVVSIQMMSRDKLQNQVRQQFFLRKATVLSRDSLSCRAT